MNVIRLSAFKKLTDNNTWWGFEENILTPSIVVNDLGLSDGVFYSADSAFKGKEESSGYLTIYNLISPVEKFDTLKSNRSAPDNIRSIPSVFLVMTKTIKRGYLRIYTKR